VSYLKKGRSWIRHLRRLLAPTLLLVATSGCALEIMPINPAIQFSQYAMKLEGVGTNLQVSPQGFSGALATNSIGNLSISFWVKVEPGSDIGAFLYIVSEWGLLDLNGFIFGASSVSSNVTLESNGFFTHALGGAGIIPMTGKISTWSHMVSTYDGALASGDHKVYHNGIFVGDIDLTAGTFSTDGSVIDSVYLGDLTGKNVQVVVDDLAVWTTTLSADAVLTLYNGGIPFDVRKDVSLYTSSGQLSAYWLMGDEVDSSGNVLDSIGNISGFHHMTINGATREQVSH